MIQLYLSMVLAISTATIPEIPEYCFQSTSQVRFLFIQFFKQNSIPVSQGKSALLINSKHPFLKGHDFMLTSKSVILNWICIKPKFRCDDVSEFHRYRQLYGKGMVIYPEVEDVDECVTSNTYVKFFKRSIHLPDTWENMIHGQIDKPDQELNEYFFEKFLQCTSAVKITPEREQRTKLTPDFLMKGGQYFSWNKGDEWEFAQDFEFDKNGKYTTGVVNWVEVKTTYYPDHFDQLKKYLEEFGPGLVIFAPNKTNKWLGRANRQWWDMKKKGVQCGAMKLVELQDH